MTYEFAEIDPEILEVVDHVEMEHEREVPGWAGLSRDEVRARHHHMHEVRSDWGHYHNDKDMT